ncbi:lipocalin family protein [Aquimarina spongiae]|uniref:Lipocalin-like domain-containing protein n=1 Tax=Aquimarina spongiae TaxID=570521 RepID=A0A1M6EKA2_9FLAO|nr:lipocalin family protein [Aquimarina spongiae]SHI85670.1 Lipocalin-like domain-containing protein [Aquimarina spongiae]
MKKLHLSLCLLMIVSLFSCGSDDNDTPETIEISEANLIGTWKLTGFSENGVPVELDACDLLYTMQLSKTQNGENIAVYVEGYLDQGECKTSTSVDYVWELVSGNLNTETADMGTDQDTEKIIELTATSLKLEYTDIEDTETIVYVDTYTRQ